MAQMSKTEKDTLNKLVELFEVLPIEKQYYLLGYAQSEADKNADGCNKNT